MFTERQQLQGKLIVREIRLKHPILLVNASSYKQMEFNDRRRSSNLIDGLNGPINRAKNS